MDKLPTELEMGKDSTVPETETAGKFDASQDGPKQVGSKDAQRMRRRLLVVGAIGAPLVMTFRSTSAWAVSAGCLVQTGTLPIPGSIIRVDENFLPIPKSNPVGDEWYEKYEIIQVLQDPNGSAEDRIVNGLTDIDRLRALVYNQNIGTTCLQSIVTPAPPV